MNAYAHNHNSNVNRLDIWFSETGKKKQYIGTPNMWMIGIEEYNCPILISDIIYVLKNVIINTIRQQFKDGEKKEAIEFAESIKRIIYDKSNNIALLSIIEAIGLTFQRELPGYAVDLASNLSLIYWDFHRYGLYAHNPTKELLEDQIQQTMGIPSLTKRYQPDPNCNMNLQSYMLSQQLNAEHEHKKHIQDKCYQILDYLYSTTKNEGEEAQHHLQIQKMDYRKAELKVIDKNIYSVEPTVTGEARKIVDKYEENKKSSPSGKIENVLNTQTKSLFTAEGEPDYLKINSILDIMIDEITKDELTRITYENTMVNLIAAALSDKDINLTRRDQLCSIWIEGINRFFKNGSFTADNKLLFVLFQQLDMGISQAIRNRIKRLMLDALLYSGMNGMIFEIAQHVKSYLYQHKVLSKAFFNTIILLAEDEMNHQHYNANYIRINGENPEFKYIPNGQPRLTHLDHQIKRNGGKQFPSMREEIITHYLFNEEPLEIYISDIDKYDIVLLSYISNCGLDFDDQQFSDTMHSLLCKMIETWHSHKGRGAAHNIINVGCVFEVKQLLQREIDQGGENADKAINLLFDEIPFDIFTSETLKIYYGAFSHLGANYFNAYQNAEKRKEIERIIQYTEEKVIKIKPTRIKTELYKPLIFAFTGPVHDDWKKYKTKFSYREKEFLNDQFSKYGMHHVKEIIFTIYMFHINELLPEILQSLYTVFENAKRNDNEDFSANVHEMMNYVDQIILNAFMHYSDIIKGDNSLIEAYEGILSTLVQMHNPRAAIILDEFRIH